MPKQTLIAILCSLALVLAIAGCGGSGSSDSSSSAADQPATQQSATQNESSGGESGSGSNEGGSSGGESGSATPARAAFIKEADAQCTKGNREQSAGIKAYSEEKHPKSNFKSPEEELLVAVVLPNIRKNIEGLGEMTPPSGDEDEVGAIVDANEKALDELEADPGQAFTAGGANTSAFAEGTKLSKAYGFKVCGQY